MFNLDENNRIVMSLNPTDMRMGVNCLSGQVRKVGLDPSNGVVHIFVGKSRRVMKILHWEHGGYVVYYSENFGLNPHQWLKHALENIRPEMDEQDHIQLLPYNYKN